MKTLVQSIPVKRALSTTYGNNIAVNPYQGCQFACAFCSAIKMNFFTGRTSEKWDATGWGDWVDYKANLLECLERERAQVRRSKIYFGNATDIYMPLERTLKLVPPILEFFLKNPPQELEVQTRAALFDIQRDIPLLQELAKKTRVLISYSIHTDRDDVRKIFEPKAPSIAQRLAGLRAYFEAGLPTRLSCMPMLPLTPENYAEIFAPYVTRRVWIAGMNHKQLTAPLFAQHFPQWMNDDFLEERMSETVNAFARRGVECYHRALTPQAKRERWEKREARRTASQRALSTQDVAQLSLEW